MTRKRIALVGTQTGDEGKGVRATYYVKKAMEKAPLSGTNFSPVWTLRWNGGGNAGHTVVLDGETYKLHQIPSGILIPGAYNLLGEGVYFNPQNGMREIQMLQKRGVELSPRNFGIASNAHVTLKYHTDDDSYDRNKPNHTSTGNGVKQTSVDKYGRVGLRFEEFLDKETFKEILKEKKFPDGSPKLESVEEFVGSYEAEMEFLSQFSVLQAEALVRHGAHYGIGEGAQGFKLDVDRGLYPGTTSSNPSIVPFRADSVLGVIKMYESSVGHDRPFVGQMPLDLENRVRELWCERGTTTGLPRDLGWIDAIYLRHAIQSSEIDFLVGTCGDRMESLADLGMPVKIVVAYEIDGRTYKEWDKFFHNRKTLYKANPVFEEFQPWRRFVNDNGELTENARRYIERIQELTGKEFVLHGIGPSVEDVIEVKDIL